MQNEANHGQSRTGHAEQGSVIQNNAATAAAAATECLELTDWGVNIL